VIKFTRKKTKFFRATVQLGNNWTRSDRSAIAA